MSKATDLLTDNDIQRGFKLYEIPVVLTVAGKNIDMAMKHIHEIVQYDGGMYDIYGFRTTGPVKEVGK